MAKIGVVLSNIGTPESPEPDSVGKYLKEFLMDPYVIDKPWWFRTLLVKGIIVPFRKKKSSANYKKIWRDEGSPLLIFTDELRSSLQELLGDDYKVVVGMRYGQPSLEHAFSQVKDCEKIILFPQYPQYAESSTRTCVEKSQQVSPKEFRSVKPFFSHPGFIQAWSEQVQSHLQGFDYDHLLLSYHGLPERHVLKTDPVGGHCGNYPQCCEKSEKVIEFCYRAQCLKTTQTLAEKLGLPSGQYSMSFQSRLGRDPWIPPFTDNVLQELAAKGVKRLAVACPSFTADCLETLEELALGGKEIFLESGGEDFRFVPCLNSQATWVKACAELVMDQY